ncbi:MAG: CoA pyrophosphatase [Proteobacteria bacterium]|nr:CoA pyrophosphatase [Pseudomonadota bacterium]
MDLSLPHVERRLAAYQPALISKRGLSRSAVAVLLRYRRESPDILLMKRSEREGDRWSGQVCLPGGRASQGDIDLRATAVRETREEVGLDLLATARPIGRLDTIHTRARARLLPLTVTPFVFVQTKKGKLSLGHEAETAFWLPVDRVASGELSGNYTYRIGPLPTTWPCWRYDGHVVWGLTYKILGQFLDLLGNTDLG